jgi:DNA-binding IclR family transcriptional regulator
VALATGPLNRLWQVTQETVGLMMPISPTHRMCVFEYKSPQPLSFSRGMGYSEPLYRGASGKVLLAHMQPEQRRAALALASRRDRELALKEIAAVLADGVLVTHGELIAGSVAVSSPVIARTREAVAAVCIFGSGLRLRGPLLRECEREVIHTAREISMFL